MFCLLLLLFVYYYSRVLCINLPNIYGCCCSVTKSCQTLCDLMDWACQASLSFTVSQSFLRFMSIELVMLSDHLILCCSLLLLPSIFPTLRVFSNESVLRIRWPRLLELQLQRQSFQWTLRRISLKMDWFDIPAVQGTLKSLLQHHSSKASILLRSVFFVVQLSHPYMSTGKTIA